MEIPTIKVQLRESIGKSGSKRVRKKGNIPAILYGQDQSPTPLLLEARNFLKLFSKLEGKHPVVKLEVEGNSYLDSPAIIKEIQYHPVNSSILHIDFQRIRLDQKIHTSVPVVLIGQAEGVRMGGVLDHQLREIEIECFATQVPQHIELDVSHLGLGHAYHVSDITPPEGVTILTEADRVVVSIHVPRTLEAKLAAEGAKEEESAEKQEEEEKKE